MTKGNIAVVTLMFIIGLGAVFGMLLFNVVGDVIFERTATERLNSTLTTDTDFNGGTNNDTQVIRTGADASVTLSGGQTDGSYRTTSLLCDRTCSVVNVITTTHNWTQGTLTVRVETAADGSFSKVRGTQNSAITAINGTTTTTVTLDTGPFVRATYFIGGVENAPQINATTIQADDVSQFGSGTNSLITASAILALGILFILILMAGLGRGRE